MSKTQTTITAVAVSLAFAVAGESYAQTSGLICDPNVGHVNSRIECLSKIVHSLNDEISSLRLELSQSARASDLTAYLRPSDLDAHLSGYVKFNSPLAINLLLEPSTNQLDGRCLKAYVGQVGVVASKPCDFGSKEEFKWQLLPAGGNSETGR